MPRKGRAQKQRRANHLTSDQPLKSPCPIPLPPQIISLIAEQLPQDYKTLLSLICVSKSAWEATIPVHYRHIILKSQKAYLSFFTTPIDANRRHPGSSLRVKIRREIGNATSLEDIPGIWQRVFKCMRQIKQIDLEIPEGPWGDLVPIISPIGHALTLTEAIIDCLHIPTLMANVDVLSISNMPLPTEAVSPAPQWSTIRLLTKTKKIVSPREMYLSGNVTCGSVPVQVMRNHGMPTNIRMVDTDFRVGLSAFMHGTVCSFPYRRDHGEFYMIFGSNDNERLFLAMEAAKASAMASSATPDVRQGGASIPPSWIVKHRFTKEACIEHMKLHVVEFARALSERLKDAADHAKDVDRPKLLAHAARLIELGAIAYE